MSRQLTFSSAISVMVMTVFALSATAKAQHSVRPFEPAPVVATANR